MTAALPPKADIQEGAAGRPVMTRSGQPEAKCPLLVEAIKKNRRGSAWRNNRTEGAALEADKASINGVWVIELSI